MKKIIPVFGLVLLALIITESCGSKTSGEKQTTKKEVAKVEYTCPMHPEVVSDKPGACPKCGMALVEKK